MRPGWTIEQQWTHDGLDCVVLAGDRGYRCGYVRVPEDHPWHRLGYDEPADHALLDNRDIEIDGVGSIPAFIFGASSADEQANLSREPRFQCSVHGGLTFSGEIEGLDGWWFGFDCSHAGDAYDESIMSEKEKAIQARYESFTKDGVVRDLPYVAAETSALARQIHTAGQAYPTKETQR